MAGLLTAATAALTGANTFLTKEGGWVYLVPLKKDGNIDTGESRALQYWPSEITDNQTANYSNKTIPGGNVPLYQWVSGSERVISFTTVFSRDHNALQTDSQLSAGIFNAASEGKHNVNVAAAVNWLRSLMQPEYIKGQQWADPPPLLYLIVPNTHLGRGLEDYVQCIMTECNIVGKKWFPNGILRFAEVSLSFAEVVQNTAHGTSFYGRSDFAGIAQLYTYKKGSAPSI